MSKHAGTWAAIPAQGYLLEYQADPLDSQSHSAGNSPSAGGVHVFCGRNAFPGAICPNCKIPLTLMLTLDTRDELLELPDLELGQIPLLYCWRCAIPAGLLRYKIRASGGVDVTEYAEGAPEPGDPYDDYPQSFPSAVARLVPLSSHQQAVLQQWNRSEIRISDFRRMAPEVFDCRHQVGGQPFLIQRGGDEYFTESFVVCPMCDAVMPFLAAIANDCLDPRGFVGEDASGTQTLFHFCRGCCEILAFSETD